MAFRGSTDFLKKKRLMSQDWMEGQSVLSQRRGMLASVHGIVQRIKEHLDDLRKSSPPPQKKNPLNRWFEGCANKRDGSSFTKRNRKVFSISQGMPKTIKHRGCSPNLSISVTKQCHCRLWSQLLKCFYRQCYLDSNESATCFRQPVQVRSQESIFSVILSFRLCRSFKVVLSFKVLKEFYK